VLELSKHCDLVTVRPCSLLPAPCSLISALSSALFFNFLCASLCSLRAYVGCVVLDAQRAYERLNQVEIEHINTEALVLLEKVSLNSLPCLCLASILTPPCLCLVVPLPCRGVHQPRWLCTCYVCVAGGPRRGAADLAHPGDNSGQIPSKATPHLPRYASLFSLARFVSLLPAVCSMVSDIYYLL
jgi:hypothetical protein